MEKHHILTIDQGTTSSRALIYDTLTHKAVALVQQEFKQYYPHSGWVEHDGEEIWQSTLAVMRKVIEKATIPVEKLAGIGITNQRETTVVWDRMTGQLVYKAIVWQDKRTADMCARLRNDGVGDIVHKKTGLYLDPYFCATKLSWILDNIPGARVRAERGELLFGTIDSFLIWRLTRGNTTNAGSEKAIHISDETNAARTSLYNIHTHTWDKELLKIFNIPAAMVPRVVASSSHFGVTAKDILGTPVPILGVAGDQQSSLFGHGCLTEGMMKSTYGTGAFLLVHTGATALLSKHKLLTTCACRRQDEAPQYAIEGSIFIAGALLKWFKEKMNFITSYDESDLMATQLASSDGVYIVPSFNGLGPPHWNARARGAVFGLTRGTSKEHLIRAGLEAIAFQTYDLIEVLTRDGIKPTSLHVDGGLATSDWLLRFMTELNRLDIIRPNSLETTALGATYLAAFQAGLYKDKSIFNELNKEGTLITPHLEKASEAAERANAIKNWKKAVQAVTLFAAED
ncbi:glycerol kinase [Spirochaetota bacterium]|nr:glycerol kinase [Spirochaetota bacterium]